MTLASPSQDNLRACLFMLAANAWFIVNDTCVKILSAEIPPPQIMAVRGLMTAALLFALAGARGAVPPAKVLLQPLVLWRTLADVAATITYIVALAHLPLANASAIFQALPLVVTLGAALFLGEPVGWRRWTAIGVGFVGVVVIVRPGAEGFTSASVLVLASVVAAAVRDLATRRMPADVPSMAVSAVTASAVSLAGCLLLPFWGWAPLSGRALAILAVAAAAIGFGYVCIVEAMRRGDMGFVAPFRYTMLLYAILVGILVLGEVPDGATLLGAAIVVGSGGYSLYRERVRGRRRPLAAPQPNQVH